MILTCETRSRPDPLTLWALECQFDFAGIVPVCDHDHDVLAQPHGVEAVRVETVQIRFRGPGWGSWFRWPRPPHITEITTAGCNGGKLLHSRHYGFTVLSNFYSIGGSGLEMAAKQGQDGNVLPLPLLPRWPPDWCSAGPASQCPTWTPCPCQLSSGLQ